VQVALRWPRAGLQMGMIAGMLAGSGLLRWRPELSEDLIELIGPLEPSRLRRIRREIACTYYRNRVLYQMTQESPLDMLVGLVRVANAEPLHRLHSRGTPVIVVGWHQGPARAASTALRKLGLPALYAVYNRAGEPDNEGETLRYADLRRGASDAAFMKRAHDALRAGTIVGLHVDWQRQAGEMVSFLDRRIPVGRGVASLARLTGARVVPVTRRFIGGGALEVRFHEPIDADDLDPAAREDFESALLDRIVRRLDVEARKDPGSFRIDRIRWLLGHPPVIDDLRGRIDSDLSVPLDAERARTRSLQRHNWENKWGDANFDAPWLGRGVSEEIKQAVADGWFPAGARALDAGCGDGSVAAWLAQQGYDAMGVDIAVAAVERARAAFGDGSGRLSFAQTDLCVRLPAGGPFAVIVDRGCFLQIQPADRRRYARHLAASCEGDARLMVFDRAFRDGVPYDDADEKYYKQLEIIGAFGAYFELERAAATYLDADNGRRSERRLPGMVFWLRRRPS